MATADERKALNESTFREANEKLERNAAALLRADESAPVPLLCECPRQDCTQVLLVTFREYERVRSDPRWTLTAPGHEDLEIERVLERTDRFFLTEKFGLAADVATEQDPRS
jgi:hypothetical protein